jgi:predicted DNA-binding transcriptional regulator YafY
VKVFAPAAEVASMIGPTVGVIEAGADADADDAAAGDDACAWCIVTIGGDADWIARYLIGLPMRFEVLEPEQVVTELRAIARRILEA